MGKIILIKERWKSRKEARAAAADLTMMSILLDLPQFITMPKMPDSDKKELGQFFKNTILRPSQK